ncbi:MAG: ABC transporter substrate-binding protein [Dermatophilaceae bacterium]
MTRKTRLTAVVAFTASLGLLAGCGSGDDQAGGKTELDVWLFGGMGLDEVIAQYEKENPDIDITVKGASSDEQAQALTTALAGGNVPDVAAIEGSYLGQFKAQPQNFVDLRDLGAKDIEGEYLDWRWAQGVAADGEVIGIPTDVGGLAVCYRKDLFAAAGLPAERDQVSASWPTWPDFIKVGQQYKAKTGKGMIDTVVNAVYNPSTQQGEALYYGDGDTLIYDSNPVVRESFDLALDAIPISAKIKPFSEEWNAAINNGDVGTLPCPSWMMNYIQQQAPDTKGKWDIAAVPESAGNAGGSQLTIPAKSDSTKEAYAFIQWLLAPEQQLAVFKKHGNFPSTAKLYDTPDILEFKNDFFGDAPVGKIYADSVKAVRPIYLGPQQRVVDSALVNTMDQVEAGQLDRGAAWDTAMKNVKSALKG